MNRVFIKTYGCQMNERDSEDVASKLVARGYALVDHERDADIVLLNTCSVRDQAEQKALGKAWEISREKHRPRRIVGILGCMAQNKGADMLDRLPDLDLIVGTQKFHRVPDHLDAIIARMRARGPRPATLIDLEAEAGSQNTVRDHTGGFKPSAFVSIMQGCDMKCAYCIVPKTRGPERARPMDDILREIESLVAEGTKEVTLLGQIVNQYGRKEFPFADGRSPFVQLLERVNAIPGLERIRYTSAHPVGYRQDLADCHGRLEKLMPQVHMPFQSGSDRILRAMSRAYSVDGYKKLVASLRAVRPDIWITTDIIVGFPGETEADHEATKRLFEETAPDMAYIFKYSVRAGTPAAPLGDPVPAEVKERRNAELLELLGKHSLRRHRDIVGTEQLILVEGPAKKGESMYEGRTPGGRKTLFRASDRLVGRIVPVRITDCTEATLTGELVVRE